MPTPLEELMSFAIVFLYLLLVATLPGCGPDRYAVERTMHDNGKAMWACNQYPYWSTSWYELAQCRDPEACNKICAEARKGAAK